MTAAISLPRHFWKKRWRALAILLGPIMLLMWIVAALVLKYLLEFSWVRTFDLDHLPGLNLLHFSWMRLFSELV